MSKYIFLYLRIFSIFCILLALIGVPIFVLIATNLWGWQVGDAASLAQLLVALLLVIPALAGFMSALDEIRRSYTSPKLDVYLKKEFTGEEPTCEELTKHASLVVASIGLIENRYRVVVVNSGDIVVNWFSIHLTLNPDLPWYHTWSSSSDGASDWHSDIEDDEHFQVLHSLNPTEVFFTSNGNIAVYPSLPLTLRGTLYVCVYRAAPHKPSYEVPYVVVTNKSKPKRGTFILKTVQETSA